MKRWFHFKSSGTTRISLSLLSSIRRQKIFCCSSRTPMSRLKFGRCSPLSSGLLGNIVTIAGRHGSEKTTLLRDLAAGHLALKIDGTVAVGTNLEGLAPSNSTFASLETGLLDRIAETEKDRQILLLLDTVVDRRSQGPCFGQFRTPPHQTKSHDDPRSTDNRHAGSASSSFRRFYFPVGRTAARRSQGPIHSLSKFHEGF